MDSDVKAQQVTKEFSMGKVTRAIFTGVPIRITAPIPVCWNDALGVASALRTKIAESSLRPRGVPLPVES